MLLEVALPYVRYKIVAREGPAGVALIELIYFLCDCREKVLTFAKIGASR